MTGIINIRLSRSVRNVMFGTCAALITLLALASSGVRAQTRSATDGSTPLALTPGAPAGSYALSGFESVNLFNGGLSFHLLLAATAGRGGVGYSLMLPIEKKWRVSDLALPQPDASVRHVYVPVPSWWESLPLRYNPGGLEGRQAGYGIITCSDHTTIFSQTLTRLTFTEPDGTEYELRDQLTGGQPHVNSCISTVSRGTVFITADGTAATFISDSTIYDQVISPGGAMITPSGYLMLRDGTRYRIDNGVVSWFRDRNGNQMLFSYDGNRRVISITDSLNRVITVNYATQDVSYDEIGFKGFGGVARRVRVNYASLSSVLRSDQSIKKYGGASGLFPELNGASHNTDYNPTVISSVTLPNNHQYQFFYNSYGELARVVLPTGGAFEYDYDSGVEGGKASGVTCCGVDDSLNVYRRVTERRVYPEGGSSFASRMTYSRPEGLDGGGLFANLGYVAVDHFKSDGVTRLAQDRHYFYGSATSSFALLPVEYPIWNEGKEYQTDSIDADGLTVLRTVMNTWQQGVIVSSWNTSIPNNPRITETTTTVKDVNPNLISKQIFGYDDTVPYNNRSDVYEYDFGAGSPGALIRHTHTDFLKTNLINGINYGTLNPNVNTPDLNATVHIRNLPTKTSVYDLGGERTRSIIEYDNYSPDPPLNLHAALTVRSGIGGMCDGSPQNCPNGPNYTDQNYKTRGNVTKISRWLNTSGGLVDNYQQYDVAGNVLKYIDPRGYATTFDFSDRFGTPDGEAESNPGPTDLAGQISYAFATKVTNALGQTSYLQFDYHVGRPVDAEDANGVVSSGYSDNEALDRPTKVIRAANQGVPIQSQTTFTYDDLNRVITTTSDRTTYNDNLLKSQTLYDGLGRTTEMRIYEGGTNFIAGRQQYDALARLYKVSNPFRPWNGETVAWTTTGFDALSRVISVTTPDNAKVSTAYSGSQVLVTDQSLKQRLSKANALGQLTDVWEITGADNATEAISFPGHAEVTAGYHTTYDYDVLDDLIKVAQGTQPTRNFVYDSLKRLISASNPESGTVNYTYDNNGNLQLKTDARGVSVHYDNDALNRPLRRWYNGSTSLSATTNNSPALPASVGASYEVVYFYDSQALPSGAPGYSRGSSTGRLVAVTYGGVSAGDYFAYDAVGHGTLKIQQTSGVNYPTSASYNLATALTSENYPSGRTVSFAYDQAGRAISVAGNLGGASRTYSTGITYSPFGGLKQEQFGTDTPVYNKLYYNSRGQLSEIRESTSPNNTSWNRGAIINHYSDQCWGLCSGRSMTDNNGNLKKQDHYIPDNDQVSSYQTYADSFAYDPLNRLQSVTESRYVSSTDQTTTSWAQAYSYDRVGNRTINTQNNATWGSGINAVQAVADPNSNRMHAPNDTNHTLMDYDAAGNQTKDYLTSNGTRIYDAENRVTSTTDSSGNNTSSYTYDGNGARVRRQVNGQETWQVYGISGELLAEYSAFGGASAPQKEYGYRNGQLLVTATVPTRANVAQSANGGVAIASSTKPVSDGWGTFEASSAINGDRLGLGIVNDISNNSFWRDGTNNVWPDWLEVDFNGSKTIDEVDLYSLQENYANPVTPTQSMTFSSQDPVDFDVQYWNGTSWVTVPNGSVTGNNKVWRQITFAAVTTTKIRVVVNNALNSRSRIVELEAWGTAAAASGSTTADVEWLVTDQLGTPRMVFDKTGSLVNTKRHDYLPFGEELTAGVGQRSAQQGYGVNDGIRQQFTQKERDTETGLDFFGARYYASTQGRFTSIDSGPFTPADPQNFNRYAYVQNNPLKFVDPTGKKLVLLGDDAEDIVSYLEQYTGYKLKRDQKTGELTIDANSTRNTKGTSKNLADKLKEVIGLKDKKGNDVTIDIHVISDKDSDGKYVFSDRFDSRSIDRNDFQVFDCHAPELSAALLGHVLEEYEQAATTFLDMAGVGQTQRLASHNRALEFESLVLSDFTGKSEQPRQDIQLRSQVSFFYTSVQYDIATKTGASAEQTTVVGVTKKERRSPQ